MFFFYHFAAVKYLFSYLKIDIPQLLEKLSSAFRSFKLVYKSLGKVFTTLEEVVPVGFAALSVTIVSGGN